MKLILHPNDLLNKKLERCIEFPNSDTIEEMFKIMCSRKGVGLAANQVGLDQAFFVARFSIGDYVCINPVIARHGKEVIEELEGCLSILGHDDKPIFKPKKRWAIIDVMFDTLHGTEVHTLRRQDARIFQHEFDHINGELCQ